MACQQMPAVNACFENLVSAFGSWLSLLFEGRKEGRKTGRKEGLEDVGKVSHGFWLSRRLADAQKL